MPQRLLIVDDDAQVATMLSRSLTRRGFAVESVSSPELALALAEQGGLDAALLDLVMPEQDGLSLAKALREKLPDIKIALLTGFTHSPLLHAAERLQIAVFIKPVVIHEIVDFLQTRDG